MRKTIIILSLLLLAGWANGQNFQNIKISSVKTGDGLYDFYAENQNLYPVQMQLSFTEFVNMTATCPLPYVGTINPGKHKIFNIKRVLLDIPGSFKYTHSTRIGAYPVNYDPNTVYDLPVAKGKETKALTFNLAQSDDPNKILWGFSMSIGDTVFACREGVVCMMTKSQVVNGYKTGENTLTILHPDNSFGKYEALADSQIFVNMGDTILRGTALGMGGGSNYAIGTHTRFSVFYVNARIDSIEQNKLRNYYQYVNPLFNVGQKQPSLLKGDKTYLVK
ncbi:MAG TPA: M23 family metallopeptidase [Prolixibacteraceae bacterium]|nr:M23 family metallopeptidase [Prolixibacteraceae bacterium]